MSTFGDALPQIYRLLNDPGQFAWSNSAVALHLSNAVRDLSNRLGNADGRTELNLVDGTAEYLLPAGIRRINSVRILPAIQAGGTQQDAGLPLQQVNSLSEFPVVSVQDAEPTHYVMSMVAGVNQDQFQIILYPTPDRDANNAIIVDHGNEYIFTSNDPANGADLAQIVPFPTQYDLILYYKTAAGLLSERIDENDIQRGAVLDGVAEKWLKPMLPVKSTQSYAQRPRAFP